MLRAYRVSHALRMPGRVEYYYAEVDTWHITHADSVEVFYFASGQTEAHHPSGLKARPWVARCSFSLGRA